MGIGPGEGPNTIALNQGVPGSYANDWFYPYMRGARAVYRSNPDAAAFGNLLEHPPQEPFFDPITGQPVPYRFSPPDPTSPYYESSFGEMPGFGTPGFCPPGAQNGINLPRNINEQALGGEPTMMGPEGAPINPLEGGRMDTMRRYAAQSEEALAASGLRVTPTAGAMWARAGVGAIKVGGVVLMLYSARKSIARIADAPESQTGAVVGEEAGSWTGGFIGNVLGSALGGAFVCSETGPGAFFCAVGFGLVGGATGSVVGGSVGSDVGQAFDTFRNMTPAERNEAIQCWPDRNSAGCRAFHEMQAIERGEDPSDPMSGF